jgi:hypothetical protein
MVVKKDIQTVFGGQGYEALGPRLSPADAKSYSTEPLYDLQTLRTLFLEFEHSDWEAELEDFHNTDIDVAAQLTVDGQT